MRTRLAGALLLAWLAGHGLEAQQDESPNGIGAWYIYFADYGLSEKVSLHHEQHLHFHGTLQGFNRFVVRPGVNVRLSPNWVGSFVYSYMYSDPTFAEAGAPGEPFAGNKLQEHRLMEQATLRTPLGPFGLSHRFRAEQRFFNNEGTRYSRFRMRYRALITLPLGKTFYANSEAEALMTPRDGINLDYRLGGSLGVRLSPHLRLQGGYVRFFLPNGQDERLKFIVLFTPDLRPKVIQP